MIVKLVDATHVYEEQLEIGPFTGELQPGSWLGIIGPNGAGKTTLLRMLSGILRPTYGTISIDGHNIYQLSTKIRAQWIATVPQILDTSFNLTVTEVVELGRLVHLSLAERFAIKHQDGHHQHIHDALSATDIVDLKERSFNLLSGGEKQRVLLAIALAQNSNILILDEPTSHLDPGHSFRFLDMLNKLAKEDGKTIVMVHHDLNLISRYCDTLWLCHKGKVVKQGTPEAVLDPALLEEVYEIRFISFSDRLTGRHIILPE